jgi:hypothetical protein
MSDWDRAAEALARGAGDVAHIFGNQEWMPGRSLESKDLAAEDAFRKEYHDQPGFGGNEVAGEIVGSLPAAAIGGDVPGAVGLGLRAVGSAAAGTETGGPGAKGAAEGAAIGAGMMGAGAAAGKAIKSWVIPDAKKLMQAGIRLTPGQMRGGHLGDFEEKVMGTLPITGFTIKKARGQSIHDFNTATLNKALAPIGEKITGAFKSGYDAVAEAGDKISAKYDQLLSDPTMRFQADQQYARDVADIQRETKTLPKAQQEQFDAIVNRALNDPVVTGMPTGPQIQEGLSTLGRYARTFARSQDTGEREMSYLLQDYQTAIRDGLSRANPAHAAQLAALSNAWHHMVVIEDAAGKRVTSGGVFMPSDLLSSVKKNANSVRARSFARGRAFLQDWASTGQKVLPSKLPNSTTADRLMIQSGLGTAAGIVGGAEVPHYAIPALTGMVLGAAPYTKPGMAIINKTANPAVTDALGDAAAASGRAAAGPASGAVDSFQEQGQQQQ